MSDRPPGTHLERDVADAYAAIVLSSDDAIYSKDADGIITTWNPAAVRLYGYSIEEACNQHISLIVPPERKGEEMQILGRVLAGERVEHFETTRLHKDGTILEVSISVSPVHDPSGNVVEAAIIARDITQQKRLEADIAAAHKEQASFRRRQALELNDEVVQGLVAAKLAFESGQEKTGLESVSATLVRAKAIVTRLLEDFREEGDLEPGDLVLDPPGEQSSEA
jgi:PAS domain S-box-containing protein